MVSPAKTPDTDALEWDQWYTEKMTIDHLILLEDHLLDYGLRSADDQCLGCMVWHCEKLRAYCTYEAPKFFDGDHGETYREVHRFAEELQGKLVNDKLEQREAVEQAKQARELRYKLIGYGVYDFASATLAERHYLCEDAELVRAEACELVGPEYRELVPFFRTWSSEETRLLLEAPQPRRKIDEILARLQAGVETIHESENYRRFMGTMAKFHHYSLGNIMLIAIQRRDATVVAGFRRWKELGRWVKRDEKGIAILAPCFPPKPKPVEPPPEEEEEEEELEPRPIYFRVVHVFDIEQTEGKPLPTVEVPTLTGEETRPLFERAESFAAGLGIQTNRDPRPGEDPETMGWWDSSRRLIWVRPDVAQDQATKTLLHEVAHALAQGEPSIGRREAETIAEGVAFTVGAHFGFDTGVRSFPYVALWSQDIKVLRRNLGLIYRVARRMIDELEAVPVAVLAEGAEMEGIGEYGVQDKRIMEAHVSRLIDSLTEKQWESMYVLFGDVLPTNRVEKDRFLRRLIAKTLPRGDLEAMETGIATGGRPRRGEPKTEAERAVEHQRRRPGEELPPRGSALDPGEEHPYARQRPKLIEVKKTTIEKHYRDVDEFHPGSFRVVKPLPNVLVYLGCKKEDRWNPHTVRCYPNPSVHKTIVPNTPTYRTEVDEWAAIGVPVKYLEVVGVEPTEKWPTAYERDGEFLEVVRAIEEVEASSHPF
jgi:hypothetical protein